MKTINLIIMLLFGVLVNGQEKYAEGFFKVQVVDDAFFKEKILTDSERNKEVIAKNMTYYNKMIKAYNAKDYKECSVWAPKAFWGSIGEKFQFKVYQNKFEYVADLMENQKLIQFIIACELKEKPKNIQVIYDYIKSNLTQDRVDYATKRATKYNETAKTKIDLTKENTYTYE